MYAQTIDAALLKLAQYPDFGRERSEVYNGARRFPIEKHIVFYQVSDKGINVARILHQRMDLYPLLSFFTDQISSFILHSVAEFNWMYLYT